jgi:DNA topoisomerase-1
MKPYTLIITEKPDAARRIASALDLNQKPKMMEEDGVPYYVVDRNGKIVVVPALGHLYTVFADTDRRSSYPIFDYKWGPRFQVERGAKRLRSWIQVISKLAANATSFIDACDFDIEGSVVGYFILKYACGSKEKVARRMKYSTLTKEEIENSYEKPLLHLDFRLVDAGRTRHEIDWLYGINLSKALTAAAKKSSGKYSLLTTGRIQGPLLKFLVAREESIKNFVSKQYWQIKALMEVDKEHFTAEFSKGKVETRQEAEQISKICNRTGQVENIKIETRDIAPPFPFDLGTLQTEAYRLFRYNPKTTSSVSQTLYLETLISYPRTNSQKLPVSIDYRSILESLGGLPEYRSLAKLLLTKQSLRPHEGEKEDFAHSAIYPTGTLPERPLNRIERNIWNLIVRRFLATFGEYATNQETLVTIKTGQFRFCAKGTAKLEEGWRRFDEPFIRFRETPLPRMKEGQDVKLKRILIGHRFTRSLPHYNPSTLLQKMEETGIGTKATRADAIQTLYNRKYIRNENMVLTDLGLEVFNILNKYCQKVVSVEMTKELEDRMREIYEDNKDRREALEGAIK